jgi:hypothetical protein
VADLEGVSFDSDTLEMTIRKRIEQMAAQLLQSPANLRLLHTLDGVAALLKSLPFEVNFWKVQNTYYEMLQSVYPDFREKAKKRDEGARQWASHFRALGQKLSVYVE